MTVLTGQSGTTANAGLVTGIYQNTGTTNTNWVVLTKADFTLQRSTTDTDFINVNFSHDGTTPAYIFLGARSNETGIEVPAGQGVQITPPTYIGGSFSFKKGSSSDKVTITTEFGAS